MAETMLQLLEDIQAREVNSPDVSDIALYTRDDPAYSVPIVRDRRSPQYMRMVESTMRLIDRARNDHTKSYLLQEAMSTSDFSLIFGDIIDRQMLGFYAERTPVWQNFVSRGTVRDFRTTKRFSMDGAEGQLSEVKELTEYPARKIVPSKYEFTIKKYGARMPFSFELMINDDLNSITDAPRRMARSARRTESKVATGLYVDASGPKATLYTAGNKNIVNIANGASSNNPILSIEGLQQAMIVLSKMVDTDGEPIEIEMIELVVPPALELTALNIVNATQVEIVNAGATANQKLIVNNWMKNKLRVTVDYYIPVIASTANGSTSWFLFASTNGNDRAALQMNFLRGYETPQMFMKSPNATRVGGGGLIDPMQGSFEDDSIDYKIRHMFGGGTLDPKMTVASNGSGA